VASKKSTFSKWKGFLIQGRYAIKLSLRLGSPKYKLFYSITQVLQTALVISVKAIAGLR